MYWTATGGLAHVDKKAAAATPAYAGSTNVLAAALDATDAYWADNHDDLWRWKKDGSAAPTKIDHASAHVTAIAVDGAHVYYASGKSLMKLPKH